MKRNISTLFMLSTLLLASGCLDDENLGLRDFPLNKPSFDMDYNDVKLKEDVVQATYDGNGTVVFDKSINRSYAIRLTPSPQETKVMFEPILTNVAADQVQYSSKGGTLKPGEVDFAVNVDFIEGTNAFESLDEQIYEVGVRAFVEGYNMPELEPFESKIMIRKEAYKANIDLTGMNGNNVSFNRTYSGGEIVEEALISTTFKVVLDKPAVNNVTVKLATSCVDEQSLSGVTMLQEVTILAGQKESKEITWTITNDFLLADTKGGSWLFEIIPALQGEESYCKINDGAKLSVTVNKGVQNVDAVPKLPADWTCIDQTKYAIHSFNQVNNVADMIDGNSASYAWAYVSWYGPHWVVLDLSENFVLKGMKLNYYGTSNSAKKLLISTSVDGENWVEQGDVSDLPASEEHIVRFSDVVDAHYLKIEFAQGQDYYYFVSELSFYK